MGLRVTTWNLEWFGKLLQGRGRSLSGKPADSGAERALQQLQKEKIAEEIRAIDPDILCIQEGPSSGAVADLIGFCQDYLLSRWTVITRPQGEPYHVRGSQGIWFLVKTARLNALSPVLLPVSRWREATALEAQAAGVPEGEYGKTWRIVHPWFKPDGKVPDLEVGDDNEGDPPPAAGLTERDHYHWRHPQTLVCTIGGLRVDFIGVHLKSKFAGAPGDYEKAGSILRSWRPRKDWSEEEIDLIEAVERAGTEARIKLTTEITDLRYYIESRFRNQPDPAVFVLGDLNDGIGQEYFERRYLFHDLISNLQGDVFFARRFLNHALFDYGTDSLENHRWTVSFSDAWDPGKPAEILLDHILFTQAVTGADALDRAPVRVPPRAGRVEHAIHEAANVVFDRVADQTSDHRPVTVDLETRRAV
ncbi:MAG: endonuclease/exonuclease/phosphatase family protein [Pseudomonadota bacterium]